MIAVGKKTGAPGAELLDLALVQTIAQRFTRVWGSLRRVDRWTLTVSRIGGLARARTTPPPAPSTSPPAQAHPHQQRHTRWRPPPHRPGSHHAEHSRLKLLTSRQLLLLLVQPLARPLRHIRRRLRINRRTPRSLDRPRNPRTPKTLWAVAGSHERRPRVISFEGNLGRGGVSWERRRRSSALRLPAARPREGSKLCLLRPLTAQPCPCLANGKASRRPAVAQAVAADVPSTSWQAVPLCFHPPANPHG